MKYTSAYISVSYSKRKSLSLELDAMIETLSTFNISSFVFVNQYRFDGTQERQMMQQAMTDIDRADLLIAETSDKGIGIGIEVGYAKAKGKPVIYVRNEKAEHSTTVSGISDFQIIYIDAADLRKKLNDVISKLLSTV